METLIVPVYQFGFVGLSYLLSVIGAFVALTAARRIRRADGSTSLSNSLVTGVALGGIGVWSMHFIGMVAVKLQMGIGYSLFETLVSLVAAIVASSVALAYVAQAPKDPRRIVTAGSLLGLGVAVMHYLGMYGMRFGGFIRWDLGIVAVSVLMAMAAASAALWLAFNTRTIGVRLAAALVMGVAVCSMHYTGMGAADFICTTANPRAIPNGFGIISALDLPVLVTLVAVGAAFIIALEQILSFAAQVAAAPRSASRTA
ncbi:MHYT domain-containing protein [Variovorax sp. JS1663]|uniref:MHYT domain-containing protein n=1 Tax=Variovorax sp. JS1663 TaxID=1851577 RepID=UPI000B347C44|nr:MHYT domain-containing protein [Variovorax sp. JS1663]OUM02948.1 histidine kinase [Variovorax sp. JS1663]